MENKTLETLFQAGAIMVVLLILGFTINSLSEIASLEVNIYSILRELNEQ